MTDKGENTTRRPVQHVEQKPIVIKDECECSVSIVLNVVDERGQVDSDGAMEKLMKQAKRRKLKESKYIPKEPAGTLIPRLAEAVKAEIAVCKQMQESEERKRV
ncbi:unnamed protein product, partial [Iphiclides podalirius]